MNAIYTLRIFALAVIINVIVSGCSKSPQEVTARQYYQVDFAKNYCRASASFTAGNTTNRLQFSDRSLITANGIADTAFYHTDPGYFIWDLPGANEVIFTFRKNGNTLINKISTASIHDIALVIDTVLSITDTMRASFIGSPIEEGEFVGMSMNRNSDSTNLWSGISAEFKGSQCTLDFSKTKGFYPGIYTVLIARQKNVSLQQADGNAGGYIQVSVGDSRTVIIK